MRFKWSIAAFLIIAVIMFVGCSTSYVNEADEPIGGDSSLTQNINLKSIKVEAQGEKTIIRLDFISGSRVAGVDETKLSAVPNYEISMLGTPYRIKIDLTVDYFDCFEYGNELFNEGIVYGAFPCKIKDGNSIYIQLSQNVSVLTKEDGAVLTLELTPIGDNEMSSYFVGFDAFEDYENGKIPEGINISPTLCNNKTDIIMISEAYNNEKSAQEFERNSSEQMLASGIEANSLVFKLEGSELPPDITPEKAQEAVQSNAVIEIGGDFSTLPSMNENGRYLCQTPSGEIIFSRLITPDSTQDDENVIKEGLWKLNSDGAEEKIETGEFYGIEQAGVSADGRYLAILDSGIDNKILYVYDMEENVLRNLGEEGLGAKTASFVWDNDNPTIYAMTGNNTYQLNRFDFTKPNDKAITSVEEKQGADTKIVLIDGVLYFADPQAGENGEIYRFTLDNPQRELIAQGKDFAVSPGGYYLVALNENPLDEMSLNYSLDLIDLKSPLNQKRIIDDVVSYAFGVDNDTLYFTTQNDEGINGQYQYAFKKYTISTGETTLLGYTKTNMFIPTKEVGKVYIIDYVMDGNEGLYITYIFDENKI